MKKYLKTVLSVVLILIIFNLILFGFPLKSRVTKNLDTMLSDQELGIYSHTMVYAEKYPELYNEILEMGEKALVDLMKDYVDHPDDNKRRAFIRDIVDTILK